MNFSDLPNKIANKILDKISPNAICVGFETLTVTSTAKQLASIPATATGAMIQFESTVVADVFRYREDGTNPTASVGKFKSHGDEIEIVSAGNLPQFKVIQGTGATGTTQLNVTYYK